MTWLEGPDPAPREGAAVWEEGAWENRLWMQIWASIPLRTEASPPKPATALLWALPGRQITFEGFGTGPTSYAWRAVVEPSSVASSAPVLAPTTRASRSLPPAMAHPGHSTPSSLTTPSVSTLQGPPCIREAYPCVASCLPRSKPELSGSMEVRCPWS